MAPAIELAERGYAVPVVVQQKWAAATPELQSLPGFAQAFLPWGRAPQVGELFRFPAAAQGLRAIAESKGEAFYRGPIAQALARFAAQHGGALTEADLAAYRPEWVTPIAQDYRGYTLHEIPPNGQGIAALIALGILSNFDVAALKVDSVAAQHLQIEAMKLAFADVYRYVAEPGAMDLSPAQMLDPAYLKQRAALIDMTKAQDFGAGNPAKGGTVYLTAADERGMMVSFIQSNYMCDAPRWRFDAGLHINVESAMDPATVQGLQDLGHQTRLIDDPYQDFGAGQFIWRLGDPGSDGYVAASDPRRDGTAVGF